MTTEEKAKAYDEALKKASDYYEKGYFIINAALVNIFPELNESEDEQKPILEVFGFKVGDAVKLKDGDGRKHIIKSFEEVEGIHGHNFYQVEFEDNSARDGIYPGEEYPNGYYTQMEKFEKEQKLSWSEEDEKMREKLLFLMEEENSIESWAGCYEWLKSLNMNEH